MQEPGGPCRISGIKIQDGNPALLDVERAELVQAAMRHSQDAVAAGNPAKARNWLSRALRLAPHHHPATLALASLWLVDDDAEAEALFERVLESHDIREAWIGAALARWRRGNRSGAATALARAYSRHVLSGHVLSGQALASGGDLMEIATAVAGDAGWCGLFTDGSLALSPPGPALLLLDGKPLHGKQLVGNQLGAVPLPRGWELARQLSVTREDRHLLGSPIDIAAIRAVEGCVAVAEGGVAGWAWHPGDPGRDPVLTLRPAEGGGGPIRQVTATAPVARVESETPLARPRGFIIAAADLARFSGAVAILGPDGRHLTGSPLHPGAARRDALATARRHPAGGPIAARVRPPPVDIVIPVYRGVTDSLACIHAALASRPRGSRVVVVDDASTEPELTAALDRLALRRRIVLIRHPRNQGFPSAANAGVRACAGRDVVLLNSDTLAPPRWLVRLRRAAYAAPDIGTATPLSNDATILSYPNPGGGNPVPDAGATVRLDTLAARANAGRIVDIPTAVGFCMYIRRDCLDRVGALREDVFAQGYGEENDFCLRAKNLGWRHVAAVDVFVAHRGGQSFGPARRHLLARNGAVLNQLHPGYDASIAGFIRADPLADARRRLDQARWHAAATTNAPSVLLVTHAAGGGVERQVQARCAAARAAGERPIVLRPASFADGSAGMRVCEGADDDYPNLRFQLPEEQPALLRLLSATRPARLELHHLLGHADDVPDFAAALAIPGDIHVHDYAAICPRMNLIGPDRRYCGEPAAHVCAACIADAGRNDGLDLPVAALRARSAARLAQATRVIVPSLDTATRLRRYFPTLHLQVMAHEDDAAIAAPPAPGEHRAERCRVVVVGAIGIEKGYDVLLACARDAAWRDLPVEFIVVGHTIDDARMLDTGRIFITGEYRPGEAVSLIRAQAATLAWVPSILPETWCFTLTEIWQAGLRAVAFDIGAPAERIRRTGHGRVLPLGLSPSATNNALMLAGGRLPSP